MKPTNPLNNSTTGEIKIFNFKFDHLNYCDTNDDNCNLFIKKFLPIVEASDRIDNFDSSVQQNNRTFISNNNRQKSSSTFTSKSATTTSSNSDGSSINNSNTTFRSPFSMIDFSMLFNTNNSCNDSTTATNSVPSNGSVHNYKTTTTKNNHYHHQATNKTSKSNNKTELVHHQDYLNNILSGFNNNFNNFYSVTTNIINFVQLSTNTATILPSIFTIKSIVNPTTSQSTNQVQQKKFQPLVNNNQNTLRKSSSSSSFIDNSSCQIASTTNIASTLSSESSSKSSSTLLLPSNNFINKSNNNINYNNNNNKQDNNSDKSNIDSIDSTTTSINSSKTKFQFIPSPTSSSSPSYNGEEENYNSSRKFSNLYDNQPKEDYDLVDEEILDIAENDIADNLNSDIHFSGTNFFDHIFSSDPKFRHLTLADRIRFEKLFREIDVDGNGVIDFNDLLHALERKGIQATHENVKHLILRSDINLDGDIDFAEFVSYCLENEKQLHIIFKDIDVNDDGIIDTSELVLAFTRAGIHVDEQEALRLVRRIKADSKNQNSDKLELNYNEFRDYLLLHPTDSLQDLMRSWRFGTFVDFGEDGIMPVDFSEKEIRTGMWWRHMLAGGVAGAVSRTSTAPLDRLKVFLQVRGAEFNGLGVCLKHMIQEGGVWSLWRGNGINVIKIAPETAIKFMAFDQLKRIIHSGNSGSEISIVERFLAGSLAGAVSQTAIYPMEVLKTRFCLRQTGQYRGLFDAAKKIYANGGIKNFYRGYVPNLIGIIPYAGIDLTIYETLKKMYMTSHSLEEAPVYVCLTCGTVSSTFGQIASYPLALIRTRMQSESGNHRSSMVDMFRTIMKNEGPRGLYRGITANIMKVAPAVSISYVVYEYNRRLLGAVMT